MALKEKIKNKIEGFRKFVYVLIKGDELVDEHIKSPWISVEDDLPCNHEELLKSPKSYRTKPVIVRFDNNMHGFAYMTKIPNKWEWFNKIKGITHWMPIPELPKE